MTFRKLELREPSSGFRRLDSPVVPPKKKKGGFLSRWAKQVSDSFLGSAARGLGKGALRGFGRASKLGEEIISFGQAKDTLGEDILKSQKLEPEGTVEKIVGGLSESSGAFVTGFVKKSLQRIAEATTVGEKIISFGRAKDTLGQDIAQSEKLKTEGFSEAVGGVAQRFAEAYASQALFGGAPKTMMAAFGQGAAITETQLVFSDVGQSDKSLTESIINAIPSAIIAGGLSAGMFGVFRWLSGGERGLARQFNKELDPPTKEMKDQFARGFKTLGDDMASVTDDAGKSVYQGKSYSKILSTAKNEIKNKSVTAKGMLQQMDDATPTTISRNDFISETLDYFDDLYGGELTKAQENTIIRELQKISEKMTRVETQVARQNIDKFLKDSDFTFKEGQKAFVTELRLFLRKLMNKRLVASATDDDVGKAYTELNRQVSIAYDVRSLSATQKALMEKAKISGKHGFWSALAEIFDNFLFPPQVTTKIPATAKAVSEVAPSVVAPAVSGVSEQLSK